MFRRKFSTGEVFVGSYKNVSNFFEGDLAYLAYANGTGTTVPYTGYDDSSYNAAWTDSSGYWSLVDGSNAFGMTLGSCDFGEYDDGSTCTVCDTTCVRGCPDSSACTYCHASCLTCDDGEDGIEECTECHCGAVKTNPSAAKSSCQCMPGYLGTA